MIDFTKHTIPAEWKQLLDHIHRVEPRAVIAGGCLRDHYLGRPVNDIDIFVPDDAYGVTEVIKRDRPKLAKIIHEPYFIFDASVRQVGYWENEGPAALTPVNLVHVSSSTCTPWDQIERFDFGVCQIAFDGELLYMTSAFGRDVKQETFTMTRIGPTKQQHEHSMKRYERLQAKYQGWKLVQPGEGIF